MYHIRQATSADSEMISKIHAACFMNHFLTLLAPKALAKYYQSFIEQSLGICFVAEEEGTMVGFIAGWEEGASYQRPLLYKNGFCFGLAIAGSFFRQPCATLTLIKPRLKVLMSFLKDYLLFKLHCKSKSHVLSDDKDKSIPYRRPNASYLSIAVLDRYRGSEAARLLNEAFIEECRFRNVREIILSVQSDNDRARTFYEKNGWNVWRSEKETIHYIYRL
jgi:ribosomal protein S18 acetylase RimI-like enzyme